MIIKEDILALQNSFSIDMKFGMLVQNKGGDMSLSPHAAAALCDDDAVPVRELSHWERHSGGGETPSER